ncbi:membrane fusion protein, cobalt-zinc-cadmium efflux system [Chitinophaga eiseniae]|uniref:Membrane fusion protein, cobalt-zinc-cadmium efflux system n=1 Tax=Chitinophaga eiseniae TaxID=634771 RepID=A0A1T4N5Z8_9BACT|nr:efflux RND transporter periplasmic adaptor subunit [Chitinophaga eiseniae]SJZ74739.1 membrane fusion protein, cobalt-zinc-cadmium efflux system [Chitinophaga eiseniae]
MKRFTAACGAVLIAASCHHPEKEKEMVTWESRGDTVIVPANAPVSARLHLLAVAEKPYQLQLLSAGIVKVIPNNYAEIAAPFAGRVLKSYVRLGEKVMAGAPLFAISSPDFYAAQKAWFQANQLCQQAVVAQRRQQDLHLHGVGAARDLEEANTNLAVQRQELENAAAALKVFNVNPQQQVLGEPLIVRAPIAGEVISNKLVNGQFLKGEDGPVAVVAQLSQVWIAGQVKEKDLRFIHEGDVVQMQVAALPDTLFAGNVFHVGRTIDENTRAADVLILCPNPALRLKPGMYASVSFKDALEKVITVPARAVLQDNDYSYVLLEVHAGTYVRRKVITGETAGQQIVVRSGLQPGDKIIGDGAFYLSAVK